MKGAFLKYLSFEKRLSSHTITSYSNDLDQFLLFYKSYSFNDNLIKIDTRAVRSWIVELSLQNLSPRSINRKLATLKSFFKYLIKRNLIESNPTSGINSLKTSQKIPQFIKEKDMMYLFDNLELNDGFNETRDLLILELLYGTGIRISELINLRSLDINFIKKEIKVLGKRDKERIIPLHDKSVMQIKKFIKIKENLSLETSELICTEKGNKTYPMLISRVVKKHLSSLINSKKYNPHLLRHTFATHILNKGGDLNSIKDLLGHKSLAATQIYTHNSIEKLKETFKNSHPRA